jgi:hypothetical protein
MKPLVIDARGTDLEIGTQHARGALHLRSEVARWVEAALERHPPGDPATEGRLDEVTEAWRSLTPGTLAQIEGMAAVYELPERGLLTAALQTYLHSLDQVDGPSDGCTAVALPTAHPLLAKNRDNDRRFLGMQTVLRVQPERGHGWLALSTAGAPGVHSSGLNTEGLCVADTHVPSSDIGPGVPRFAAMMHLLELCTSTGEALDYLSRTPQMGLGTLTLLDADGHAAVVECAHSRSVVLHETRAGSGDSGAVVATNHFVSPQLAGALLDPRAGTPSASSHARRRAVRNAFAAWTTGAPPDESDVRELMGSHVDPGMTASGQLGSVCQHGPGLEAETISTAIYDPVERRLDLCLGTPCSERYTRLSFSEPPPSG